MKLFISLVVLLNITSPAVTMNNDASIVIQKSENVSEYYIARMHEMMLGNAGVKLSLNQLQQIVSGEKTGFVQVDKWIENDKENAKRQAKFYVNEALMKERHDQELIRQGYLQGKAEGQRIISRLRNILERLLANSNLDIGSELQTELQNAFNEMENIPRAVDQ